MRFLSLLPSIFLIYQGLRSYGLSDFASALVGFLCLSIPVLILNFDIEVGIGIKFLNPVEEQKG